MSRHLQVVYGAESGCGIDIRIVGKRGQICRERGVGETVGKPHIHRHGGRAACSGGVSIGGMETEHLVAHGYGIVVVAVGDLIFHALKGVEFDFGLGCIDRLK